MAETRYSRRQVVEVLRRSADLIHCTATGCTRDDIEGFDCCACNNLDIANWLDGEEYRGFVVVTWGGDIVCETRKRATEVAGGGDHADMRVLFAFAPDEVDDER